MSDLPEPITREEMFLSAVAGESATLPAPVTREELFLAKAAGENVTTPEPVTRREMFLDAIASGGGGGGGGGNPNYIETIEGTLANPWGDYSCDYFIELVGSRNVTAILTFTANTGQICESQSLFNEPRFFAGRTAHISYFGVVYKTSGAFSYARSLSDEVDIANENTPCTLTIIHHPMPTSEG